ncbi:MAG: COG1361 S-layer family protein [[Clostridium] symbiosum]
MNKWKRLPVIALLVMLLAITGTRTVTAEMLDMNEFNDDMITVNKVPRGKAGSKISIKMTIHNTGTKGDNNIEKIRLANSYEYERIMERQFGEADDGEDGDLRWYDKSFPFEADSSTFKEKDVNVKPGSSKSVTLSYKLRRDLAAGYYQAFFIIDGGTEVGVNIWVSAYDGSTEEDENTKIEYDFSIGDGQFTPFAAYNQVMNFGVNLTNTGLKKVYDVRVEMQLDADVTKFPFNINEGTDTRKMGDMEPGQMVTVPYSMAVREDVKSGFFPIHYLVSYREEENGDFSEPVDLIYYVRVQGKDEDELSSDAGDSDRTKARIIVDSFSTVPEEVYAGQPFELRVRMKNASSNVTSSNIMFTFASEESADKSPVFTSDSGSTSMVVNQLGPGATTDLSMVFKSSPTAEQMSYTMTIVEQYDSPEFKNAKEEVKISIPVKQVPRLNTGTIEVMPDSISVGSETNVMFGINNTGKVLLYNVMVRFEADSIQTTDAYVGNIKPGETGNLDTMVSGVAPTEDDGKVKIIITYEDENGLTTEVEKEMLLFVNEPIDELGGMEAGNMGVDGMGGGSGMNGADGEQTFFNRYKKVIFPAAALFIIITGTTVIVIRKKKKAAQEEGMDDEIL